MRTLQTDDTTQPSTPYHLARWDAWEAECAELQYPDLTGVVRVWGQDD